MAKIIQFKLPSLAASGNVGYKTPIKRDNPPPRRQKEPIVLSVMPEQAFPTGHRDLRPLLQRDGLILLSWAVWEDWYGDDSLLRRYIITWVTSRGKARHYATKTAEEKDLAAAVPERRGDPLFYRGAYGNWYDLHDYSDKAIADYLYLAAPFDLSKETIPGFVRVLKDLGSTADFDHVFSLGAAKKTLRGNIWKKLRPRKSVRVYRFRKKEKNFKDFIAFIFPARENKN
jgi:hypothetical protein